MNRARILTVFAVATGIALGAACSDSGDGGPSTTPVPGTLSVVLDATDNNAAAIQFSISGAGITAVQGSSGLDIYQRTSGNTVNIAAVGSLGDGATVVTFSVPDVNGSYTVSVVDVADSSNQLLDTNNYTLSVQ